MNIDNVKNNLSNVCYLFENLRLNDYPDCIVIEYVNEDGVTAKALQKKLNHYFKNQTFDTIDISPLNHLELEPIDALYRSYSAFRRINGITVNKKKKYVIIDFVFLTSVERVNDALELLENNEVDKYVQLYPELTEIALYDQTDQIMVLLSHLHEIVTLKNEEDV
jgi:hypothetical protein